MEFLSVYFCITWLIKKEKGIDPHDGRQRKKTLSKDLSCACVDQGWGGGSGGGGSLLLPNICAPCVEIF